MKIFKRQFFVNELNIAINLLNARKGLTINKLHINAKTSYLFHMRYLLMTLCLEYGYFGLSDMLELSI